MVAIMRANAGAILLLNQENQELVLRAAVGIPEDQILGCQVKVGEDFAGRVVSTNNTLWVSDAQTDPSVSSPYILNNHIRGIIGVPMRIGGEIIGVVHVDFLVAREFGHQEERLLQVVAERAALAIYQARLLEHTTDERNRLQAVLDTAPVGIAFFSARDNHVQLANKAFETSLGRSILEGTGAGNQTVNNILLPNGEPFPLEEMPAMRSLRGETVVGVEILIRRAPEDSVFVQVNSAPLYDTEKHIIGAIITIQDITRIKEQEILRDEFISAAAHELKTPTSIIKGYAQLLRRQEQPSKLEAGALESIDAQTDRIDQRVQEMLKAVRLRENPPEYRRVHFDLSEFTAEMVERMRDIHKHYHLTLKRDGAVPVEADRERIEETLVSLIDNAIKFSPKGGEINVRVSSHKGEGLVAVQDHGVGIPKDRQAHIFEPFYEPVPSGTPGYRGIVALGLYLSKLIVERQGGRIWLESEVGQGSTFFFALPLAKHDGND
jgi:PAS domain S-box-containing protein